MKPSRATCVFLAISILLSVGTTAWPQQNIRFNQKVTVGTKEAPPFAMKNPDGTWRGISIDLWKEIAARQQIDYEFKEYDLAQLLEAVKTKQIDIAVGALTITPEREKFLDFSHAFYVDGLGIAVPKSKSKNWLIAVKRFISWDFLKVISVLALILLIFGFLSWFFERKLNKEQFDPDPIKGLSDGFWWSAVTMTTVGYGDKAPKTLGGRLIALVWMFTSVIIISSFTAAITSAITVSQLEGSINGPNDLIKAKVGTVQDSASATVLKQRGIECQYYENLKDALSQLQSGKIHAVVYDAPLLQYIINQNFKQDLRVLPHTFIDQPYGLAFSTNYPFREQINQSMLEVVNSPQWPEMIERYLGAK